MKIIGGAALLGVAVAGLYAAGPYLYQTGADELPVNYVAVSDRIATSGQPSRAQLAALRARGFEVVINLAPPDSYGAVDDEAQIAAAAGMHYASLPVDWWAPSRADLQQFSALLDRYAGRRILVHCQMNLRASVFTFLHRTIRDGIAPDTAIARVHDVWVPNSTWQEFIHTSLAEHQLALSF
jgi:protein tyrosine phosphatase (PTP) superfamily phosphohydrolase (DUF442 family)